MQDEQIAASGLEGASLEGFFKELLGRGQVIKQSTPGADLGLAGTLDDNVKILFERGKKREDAGKDGALGGRRRGHVHFVVEDLVKKDFQGMSKIF